VLRRNGVRPLQLGAVSADFNVAGWSAVSDGGKCLMIDILILALIHLSVQSVRS
jgi:hypothetical protein